MLTLLLALREMAVPLMYVQTLLVVALVQVHAITMLFVGSPVLGLTSRIQTRGRNRQRSVRLNRAVAARNLALERGLQNRERDRVGGARGGAD